MLRDIGVGIPREQALRIARRILDDAERERAQLSERETGLLDVIRELETQCERCGLRLSHMPSEHDEMYSAAMITTNADTTVQFIHSKKNGELIL